MLDLSLNALNAKGIKILTEVLALKDNLQIKLEHNLYCMESEVRFDQIQNENIVPVTQSDKDAIKKAYYAAYGGEVCDLVEYDAYDGDVNYLIGEHYECS